MIALLASAALAAQPSWRAHTAGSCGAGTRASAAFPATLKAVSAPADAPQPRDECGAFIVSTPRELSEDAAFELEVVFTPRTDRTILFAVVQWRGGFAGAAAPVSGYTTLPGLPPGRAALLRPDGDLPLEHPPLRPGRSSRLTLIRRCDGTSLHLDGRELNGPAAPPGPPRQRNRIEIYTEAQVGAGETAEVGVESVSFKAGAACPQKR